MLTAVAAAPLNAALLTELLDHVDVRAAEAIEYAMAPITERDLARATTWYGRSVSADELAARRSLSVALLLTAMAREEREQGVADVEHLLDSAGSLAAHASLLPGAPAVVRRAAIRWARHVAACLLLERLDEWPAEPDVLVALRPLDLPSQTDRNHNHNRNHNPMEAC